MVVVEAAANDIATVVYASGAGPRKDGNMGYARYSNAKVTGDTITVDRGNNLTITLVLARDGRTISFEHTLSDAPSLKGTLTRGD